MNNLLDILQPLPYVLDCTRLKDSILNNYLHHGIWDGSPFVPRMFVFRPCPNMSHVGYHGRLIEMDSGPAGCEVRLTRLQSRTDRDRPRLMGGWGGTGSAVMTPPPSLPSLVWLSGRLCEGGREGEEPVPCTQRTRMGVF